MNRSRLQEPAPEDHIKQIALSVCQYPPDDKRGIGGVPLALRRGADQFPLPETMQWPAPIDEAAYYGLAGKVVRTIEPQTEADPDALLIHVLVGVGNLFGRSPHFRVGARRHCRTPARSRRKALAGNPSAAARRTGSAISLVQ